MSKKIIYYSLAFLLIALILMKFVSSVTVVEVPKTEVAKEEEKKGIFSFLKNPIFWYAVVGFLLFCIVMLIVFFVVRWIVKFIKQRNDIYWKMRTDRMQLAKIHARYSARHWFKVHKNTPIRIAKKDENGRLYISKPIGFHRGDYVTHEGNLCISMNLDGNKKFFFFPTRDLLIIPNKEKVKITQRNDRGEKIREEEYTLPHSKDIIQWNENEILLFIEGVSRVGIFLIPVIKDKDGKILDLALPTYSSLKEVIIGDFLYEQTKDFVNLTRKAVEMNVDLRAKTKLMDSNQNVEVSQAGTQQ
jgi:hypothetical protein